MPEPGTVCTHYKACLSLQPYNPTLQTKGTWSTMFPYAHAQGNIVDQVPSTSEDAL